MINFPDSPTDGQTYAYGGVSYVYNDPPGTWTIYGSNDVEAPSSTFKVHVGVSAPSPLVNGLLWYDTNNNLLLIYIDDGDGEQWIQI